MISCMVPALIGCISHAEKNSKPNIILIMADDLGMECLGCYGSTSYETPNLDRMAEQGLRFTSAYAQPLSTPTRVQLMTGKYNHRNWMAFGLLDPRERTFGHMMSDAGYRTCIAGKWQLWSYDPPDYPGGETRRGKGMHPDSSGFEEYSLFHALHTEDKGSRYANPTFLRNGTLHKRVEDKYGEDLNVEFISDFMKKHREEAMFIYYPMSLTHAPFSPTPASESWNNPEMRMKGGTAYFPDMVRYMDILVGRLIHEVINNGLEKNTIIIFYSDNGTDRSITSKMNDMTVPGGKGLTTQAGIRVPLIAYWPGKIKPGVCDDLVDATDFFPTLAELAGNKLPEDGKTDGVSFAPRLFGLEGTPRANVFSWYDPRPGWDKDKFTLEIFAADHDFKLFSDGRMFRIDRYKPLEESIDTANLSPEARKEREKLRKAINEQMRP